MEPGGGLRRAHLIAAALIAALTLSARVPADGPPRDLTLEDLDGAPIRIFSSTARAWVFVFTRTDCPVAARYAPELQRLQAKARSTHMEFHLVFVDPAETPAAIRAYLRDYGYGDEALRDPAHRLVRATDATTTPEAVVFVPSRDGPVLAYRGRIDDRYVDIGRVRPAPTTHDLGDILAAIANGQQIAF